MSNNDKTEKGIVSLVKLSILFVIGVAIFGALVAIGHFTLALNKKNRG